MIDVDDPVLHIQVTDRQPTELRDAHPGMEQDVKMLHNIYNNSYRHGFTKIYSVICRTENLSNQMLINR